MGLLNQRNKFGMFFSKKISDQNTYHNPFPITNFVKKYNIANYTNLGKGEILCIESMKFYNTIKKILIKKPYFLTLKYKKNL